MSTFTTTISTVAEDAATVVSDAALSVSSAFAVLRAVIAMACGRCMEPTAPPMRAHPRPLMAPADAPVPASCTLHKGRHQKCAWGAWSCRAPHTPMPFSGLPVQ